MPDNKTHKARQAKRKKRIRARVEAGDLEAARRMLWQGIAGLDEAIRSDFTDVASADTFEDAERRASLLCKCTHALAQASAVYDRLVEATEHEARLRELEIRQGIAPEWARGMPQA